MRVFEKVFKGVMMLVIVAAMSVLLGFVVERLWNWLMPGIFGLRTITYWQGVGLFFLSKLLLGGFPRSGGRGRGYRNRGWKQRMERKWSGMSDEERAKFRAGMRGRQGFWGPEERERFRAEVSSRWADGRGWCEGRETKTERAGGDVASRTGENVAKESV
jgi:hypothetical protein